MVKTLHIPLYKRGKVVHIAAIRSDWKQSDYRHLAKMFPYTYMRSKSQTCPTHLIGVKSHNTDFIGLKKYEKYTK